MGWGVAEWSARRICNPAVSGSSSPTVTGWICSVTAVPNSNPLPRLLIPPASLVLTLLCSIWNICFQFRHYSRHHHIFMLCIFTVDGQLVNSFKARKQFYSWQMYNSRIDKFYWYLITLLAMRTSVFAIASKKVTTITSPIRFHYVVKIKSSVV